MEITLDKKEVTKEQAFKLIQKFLDREKDASIRKCMDEVNFDKAAWSEFQAFQLGYQKALFKLGSFVPNPLTKGNEDV